MALSQSTTERDPWNWDRYGNFVCTDAVRPCINEKFVPTEGFQYREYELDSDKQIPYILASLSLEKLWEVFYACTELLPDTVDVALDTSDQERKFTTYVREYIDLSVVQSYLWDYQNPLLHDGLGGIGLFRAQSETEVQLDEHKLLFLYGMKMRNEYEYILRNAGVPLRTAMKFIIDGVDHEHSSYTDQHEELHQLVIKLGAE